MLNHLGSPFLGCLMKTMKKSQAQSRAKRTGVVVATGFLTCTVILLYACRTGVPAEESGDALGYAVRLARAVPVDDDTWVREQGKVLERAVRECARQNQLDRGKSVADGIASWQRGSAYAVLAVAFAKDGRMAEAEALLRKAEEWQKVMRERYEAGTLGWSVGRISGHVAAARVALGILNPQQAVGAATQSVGYVSSFGVAMEGMTTDSPQRVLAVLESLGNERDPEVQAMFSEGALQWCGHHPGLTTNELSQVAEAVHKSLICQPVSSRVSSQCRLAGLWWRCGAAERAEGELHEARVLAERLPEGYVKAVAHGEIAVTCFGWGQEAGKAMFEKAIEEAGRCVGSDRLQAYSRLAVEAVRMNDDRWAVELFGRALDEAESLSTAQVRRLRLADVSLAVAEAWPVPQGAVLRRLAMAADREASPGDGGRNPIH